MMSWSSRWWLLHPWGFWVSWPSLLTHKGPVVWETNLCCSKLLKFWSCFYWRLIKPIKAHTTIYSTHQNRKMELLFPFYASGNRDSVQLNNPPGYTVRDLPSRNPSQRMFNSKAHRSFSNHSQVHFLQRTLSTILGQKHMASWNTTKKGYGTTGTGHRSLACHAECHCWWWREQG